MTLVHLIRSNARSRHVQGRDIRVKQGAYGLAQRNDRRGFGPRRRQSIALIEPAQPQSGPTTREKSTCDIVNTGAIAT